MTENTTNEPQPATDRTALRERIADTLAEADGWRWVNDFDKARSSTYRSYQSRADAVLALLPEPADRATVLREAADVALGRVDLFPDTEEGALAAGALEGLADVYRRMAGSVGHACSNCEGVAPDSCLMNPDRTREPEPAQHLGGKVNAEDCPGCRAERRNLPYPFLCPAVAAAQQSTEA